MSDLSAAQVAAAKDELRAAISKYYDLIEPGTYVSGWAVILHTESVEMASEGSSAVCIVVPNDQAFPLTRGMLEIAIEIGAKRRTHS